MIEPGHLIERTIKLSDFAPHPRNYNRHPKDQLEKLRTSLKTFGQVRNIVVWRSYFVAGHGLAEAAQLEGWPALRANVIPDDWPEAKVLAYLAADNVLGAQGDPDQVALAQLVQKLHAENKELFSAIGLGQAQADKLLAAIMKGPGTADPDAAPAPSEAAQLAQKWGTAPGQLWILDTGAGWPHRLYCGDCTDPAAVATVLAGLGAQVTATITDPPYGQRLDASYSNSVDNPAKGIKKSRGYDPVEGDDQDYDPRPMLAHWDAKEVLLWGADFYRQHLPAGGSWIVWDKRATLEDLVYSSSEFELCFSKVKHHRVILRVPWFGLIGTEQQDVKKRIHPAQKPLGVISPLVEKYGGAVVADPYAGSGTTIIACQRLGRRCVAMEKKPEYTAVILQRFLDATGATPTRLEVSP